VQQRQAEGYRPWDIYHGDDELRSAIDLIAPACSATATPSCSAR
jgi:hypothetical protein